MKTICCLKDLEQFGFDLLTGEACGLGYRLLCDVTEKGRRVLSTAFGFQLPAGNNWNRGSAEDPHVGSILLDPDAYLFLGVFALLENGCGEVYRLQERISSEKRERALRDAISALQMRILYIGRPEEPRSADGRPDWSVAVNRSEAAMEECRGRSWFNASTLYGFEKTDTKEEREHLLHQLASDGWTFRRFSYQGTAGPRNRHEMSGRVT